MKLSFQTEITKALYNCSYIVDFDQVECVEDSVLVYKAYITSDSTQSPASQKLIDLIESWSENTPLVNVTLVSEGMIPLQVHPMRKPIRKPVNCTTNPTPFPKPDVWESFEEGSSGVENLSGLCPGVVLTTVIYFFVHLLRTELW